MWAIDGGMKWRGLAINGLWVSVLQTIFSF